jgi:hypothetical protein
MAAAANQVHSAAQQIGARIGWNPIDAATRPPTVRVSVSLIFLIHGLIIATWASRIPSFQAHLHLSPAVLGRSLMMAAIGSVLAMPAAG